METAFHPIVATALGAALAFAAAGSLADKQNAAPSANLAEFSAATGAPSAPSRQHHRLYTRDADGLFRIGATINGVDVRFVVDTGATVIVLTAADAARTGLTDAALGGAAELRTAGGSSAMRWTKVRRLEVAGQTLANIDAAVVDAGASMSLLGQNALQKLGTVTLRGSTLRID